MNIDIEDYLEEANTRSLVRELKSREGYENIEATAEQNQKDSEVLQWADKFNKLCTLSKLKEILKLRHFATKDEIIKEINEL